MVVTRSMTRSLTGIKEADTKKKEKANKTMGVTTSMTRTKKTDDKRKKRRRQTFRLKEMEAYSMFMITDFLKRYYENHPRSTTGLIPDDAEMSGSTEWLNMSETERASWVEKHNNMKATGKTLYQLRCEYYFLYDKI